MSPPAAILIYGPDPRLIDPRRMVLETSGHMVSTAIKLPEVDRMTSLTHFDLLSLCYTLSMKECGRVWRAPIPGDPNQKPPPGGGRLGMFLPGTSRQDSRCQGTARQD